MWIGFGLPPYTAAGLRQLLHLPATVSCLPSDRLTLGEVVVPYHGPCLVVQSALPLVP